MQLSAQEIAQILGGTVEGDATVMVTHPGKIEEGDAGSITFLGNAKYESYLYSTAASVVIVDQHYQPKQPVAPTLVRVPDVYAAVAALLAMFGAPTERARSISPQAAVDDSAVLGADVGIGRFTVVEAGAHIGANSLLYDQVYVGAGAKLGRHVVLYPGVRVMERCVIGDHCVLHPNVVIGGDGFGFAPQPDGSYQKIAHAGNVVLENNVEVGAGTTIDRASIGSTLIREGVKLDNLVQIAHNVEIGAHTVIAAQAGVAGSTKIGSHCRIGGQVGFAGHLRIADGTEIQAQSGIASHVKTPKTQLFGSPAIPYRDYVRAYAVFKQLPDLYKQVHRLEQELKAYRQGDDGR